MIVPDTSTIINEANDAVAVTDTIYIEKRVTDTIVQVERTYTDRVIYQEILSNRLEAPCAEASVSGILNSNDPRLPRLSTMELENVGNSAINDETLILVENFSFTDPR